jgi:hypothetical protein
MIPKHEGSVVFRFSSNNGSIQPHFHRTTIELANCQINFKVFMYLGGVPLSGTTLLFLSPSVLPPNPSHSHMRQLKAFEVVSYTHARGHVDALYVSSGGTGLRAFAGSLHLFNH